MADRMCSVNDCERPSRDVGLCIMHASRWRRTGTTDDPSPTATERFWSKVDRNGHCWLWTGSTTHNGYGRFWVDGKSRRAHRVAWEMEHGPIPEGDEIDHLCHTPACVRVEHLRVVDSAENTRSRRPFEFAASQKTHCKHGHPFDEANTAYKTAADGTKHRQCRACQRERSRARRERERASVT